MQLFKTFRTISLILFFVLVSFGCATNKNQVSNSDFGFTAESVPEGILLTFSNIPIDAIRMTIHVTYFDTEVVTSPRNVYSSFADLRDASFIKGAKPSIQLERVKQSKKVIFPVVQAGQNHSVMAYVYNHRGHELWLNDDKNYKPVFAETSITPKNGTFFDKDNVSLELNNTNSKVTLTKEPIFTSELTFDKQKYSFNVTVLVPEHGSISAADHHYSDGLSADGLTWVFEPNMTEDLTKYNKGWLESGTNYYAWANVFANIIYDDIFWYVPIAKSQEFNYSL